MRTYYTAGLGIYWLCMVAGCTVVDSNPGDSIAPGWGLVELRGESQLVRVEFRTLTPEAKAQRVVRFNFGDGRQMVLSLQTLTDGVHRIGAFGDGESGGIFTEPRRLWTGDRGYIETARAPNAGLTGYFYIEFFDSVSSCYRCDGSILIVEGRFHAVEE